MKLAFLRLISETVLILRLLRSILPWVSLICATLMALGLGMALLGDVGVPGGGGSLLDVSDVPEAPVIWPLSLLFDTANFWVTLNTI
jgi:hypothetical protein